MSVRVCGDMKGGGVFVWENKQLFTRNIPLRHCGKWYKSAAATPQDVRKRNGKRKRQFGGFAVKEALWSNYFTTKQEKKKQLTMGRVEFYRLLAHNWSFGKQLRGRASGQRGRYNEEAL